MKRQSLVRVQRTYARGDRVKGCSRQFASRGSYVQRLQRSIGNRAVQRLIRSPYIQAKLKISTPGDRFEQEADRVADTVMRMSSSPRDNVATSISQPQISRIQRTCATCEKEAAVVQRACKSCHGGPLEENEPLQREAEDEDSDEMLQGADGQLQASEGAQSQINNLKGGGQPLSPSLRSYFEPRFGQDFSGVRLHTDANGASAARSVNAKAFTLGSDVAFAAGQYSPETNSGKRLLAHELTHVVQQGGTKSTVQRVDHVADTGFRYTPPASVTRTIVEIQGIVNATPDGVYGENTRRAVEVYQGKLKALGLYKDTLDGKWGKNTEEAHKKFAIEATPERASYNCTGFALKDYVFRGLAGTRAVYATMTKLADCSKPCNPFFYKFFLWRYNLEQVNTKTGVSLGSGPDFHTVSGQTDSKGNGPAEVMSKNGPRPVEGPKPPLDWKPLTGPTIDSDGNPVPNNRTIRTGHVEECFCNEKLPGRP